VSSIPAGSAPQAASRRKPLGREAECLRELAGKGLVANDEGQLHDLRLTEVLVEPRPALVCNLLVVADDALAELQRRALPRARVGARRVRGDVDQLLARGPRLPAVDVTQPQSVRAEQRAHP